MYINGGGDIQLTFNRKGDVLNYGTLSLRAYELDALIKLSKQRRLNSIPTVTHDGHLVSVRSDGTIQMGCQRILVEDADRVHALSRKARGLK